MRSIPLFLHPILLIIAFMAAQSVSAADISHEGVSLSRTRIIFMSSEKAQTITMQNHGSRSYLVQSAVIETPEGGNAAPFMTTPPMFRLEANSKNILRILRKGSADLPADRESVFYFTAIAVPAGTQPTETDPESMSARVSVGLQNTIKLFNRPTGLAMTPEEAEGRLTFVHQDGKVVVNNPTPYYLTLSQLKFDAAEVKLDNSTSMIAPFSQARYPATPGAREAQWSVINDYGGSSKLYKSGVAKGHAS